MGVGVSVTRELAQLGRVDEWGSAEPPGLRTDVFGGSLWGWQAL